MDYLYPRGECISIFDVCEAHRLLEAFYNVGGMLWERPSNRRRRESTGHQLARLGYSPGMRAVDLWGGDPYDEDEMVRFVYFANVLKLGLPIDAEDRRVIDRIFTVDGIEQMRPDYYDKEGM
jgi:hypothetical protein